MARPEIKSERRAQILDAFETCVARYGIEGATLAKTADTAGLARPLVRHNIGNREELLEALIDRFLSKSKSNMSDLIAALPENDRAATAVEWLFDPNYSDPQLVQVSNALIAASADNPALAKNMQNWLDDFIAKLDGMLSSEFPQANSTQISAVAAGLTGIYFNVEALYPLGNIDALVAASKQAALLLIGSLETAK